MMIISNALTRALLAGTLLSTVLPVGAQSGPAGQGAWGRGAMPGRCYNLPDLPKALQEAVEALAEKHRPALEAKRQAAWEAREALSSGLAKSGVDRATLKAWFDKESQARFALLEEHQALRQETAKILSRPCAASLAVDRRWPKGSLAASGLGAGHPFQCRLRWWPLVAAGRWGATHAYGAHANGPGHGHGPRHGDDGTRPAWTHG